MWQPSEPFTLRNAARRRREAYVEVMRRAAAVYAFAEQVAPELGMSAAELIEDGRRFWPRAWVSGARRPHDIDRDIITGESPFLSPVAGDEEPFALPSFFSAAPRAKLPALPMARVRVTLDQVLRHPALGSAARREPAPVNDD
jgi:hypothetical protein